MMKKETFKMKKMLALLMAMALAVSMTACGNGSKSESSTSSNGSQASSGSSTSQDGGNLVGVTMPTKDLQRWNQDGENMKDQLQAAGYTVDLQYAANDIPTQVS